MFWTFYDILSPTFFFLPCHPHVDQIGRRSALRRQKREELWDVVVVVMLSKVKNTHMS